MTGKDFGRNLSDMKNIIVLMGAGTAILLACNSQPSPRQVTMDFVGSVIEGDSTGVEKYLDLDAMVDRRMQEIPPTDSTQTHAYFRDKILANLTGDGGIRADWKSHRCVVNNEKVAGDTAEVELTLMNQSTGQIHYLKVYLYHGATGWRAFYFL